MTNEPDPLAEYGPAPAVEPAPRVRNKTPTAKYIAYERSGASHTFTCRPAPSSRAPNETEDQWLDRAKAKYVPADAINVRIESD